MPKSKPKSSVNLKKASFTECPCVGATLDKLLQPALLAILAEGPLHGYELARRLGDIPGFLDVPPDVSGIYRLLKTMEARGMVVADWDVPETGRAKRLYSITEAGRHCLKLWHRTLQDYRETVDALLKVTRKALKR